MPETSSIAVDPSRAEPVYIQIADRIRSAIVAGDLPPGHVLPGVRTLAQDLGVNLNTVARAYRLLEDQAFVRIRDRSGAEVTAPAGAADPGTRERLSGELRVLLARMRQAGFSLGELERLAASVLAALAGRGGSLEPRPLE